MGCVQAKGLRSEGTITRWLETPQAAEILLSLLLLRSAPGLASLFPLALSIEGLVCSFKNQPGLKAFPGR